MRLLPILFCISDAVYVSVEPTGFQTYYTGLARPPVVRATGQETTVHTGGTPARLDWRERIGDVPVRNQAGCGSCWAFATIGPVEFLIRNLTGTTEDLSEQALVSCNQDGFSCTAGGWWAFDTIARMGIMREDCLPYVARDTGCAPRCPSIANVRLKTWQYVDRYGGKPPVDALKRAVLQMGPLAVAVSVGNEFFGYKSGIFDFNAALNRTDH